MKEYEVSVNFAGFVGCDENYQVLASSDEEAEEEAFNQAIDDLSVTDIEQISDDEFDVTVSFCTFVGCEETYTVYAEDEEDAEAKALDEASGDLSCFISSSTDVESTTKINSRKKSKVSASKKAIKARSANQIVDLESILWDIADRYNTSEPVSGDWDDETIHEMNAIAEALNISAGSAKALMIHELGFNEEDFVMASTSLRK